MELSDQVDDRREQDKVDLIYGWTARHGPWGNGVCHQNRPRCTFFDTSIIHRLIDASLAQSPTLMTINNRTREYLLSRLPSAKMIESVTLHVHGFVQLVSASSLVTLPAATVSSGPVVQPSSEEENEMVTHAPKMEAERTD